MSRVRFIPHLRVVMAVTTYAIKSKVGLDITNELFTHTSKFKNEKGTEWAPRGKARAARQPVWVPLNMNVFVILVVR